MIEVAELRMYSERVTDGHPLERYYLSPSLGITSRWATIVWARLADGRIYHFAVGQSITREDALYRVARMACGAADRRYGDPRIEIPRAVLLPGATRRQPLGELAERC